ncbi:hypothetical protein B5X24_HaOG213085 [Helicoverpa armigera]|nr:hypothetical protein B5X24_HaOG213085 [Helicoverpa armigera]
MRSGSAGEYAANVNKERIEVLGKRRPDGPDTRLESGSLNACGSDRAAQSRDKSRSEHYHSTYDAKPLIRLVVTVTRRTHAACINGIFFPGETPHTFTIQG